MRIGRGWADYSDYVKEAYMNKPRRIVDEGLLEEVRRLPCAVCGRGPVDPAHIKSRGAGGPDTLENLLPLCRSHHTQHHRIGWVRFCDINPKAHRALVARGWEFEEENGRTVLRRFR